MPTAKTYFHMRQNNYSYRWTLKGANIKENKMSMQPPAGQSQQPQKPKTGLMAIIAILAMLAAGCGSDTDSAAPADTAEETSTAAPAPAPEDPEPAQSQEPLEFSVGDGTEYTAPLIQGTTVWIEDESGPAWELQVVNVDWDYTQADFAPSAAGTYVALTVDARNLSDEPMDPYITLDWELGDVYGNFFEESMQTADEDLANVDEVAPDETATGVIVFEVPMGMDRAILGFSFLDGPFHWIAVI